MQEKNRLIAEIATVQDMHMLAQAYEEISVIRMQGIRGLVLKTRTFLSELSDVFYQVKASYRNQILRLMQQHKKKNITRISTMKKNGKSVLVFLSTNKRLYGDITYRVFSEFLKEAKTRDSDLVIIGSFGRNLFDQFGVLRPYRYFELPDTHISFDDLKPLISYIVEYEHVSVFYGKFTNIISQSPTYSDISGEQPFEAEGQQVPVKYLFEPSLETILNFFETQIFTSLFQQTVHESELSYYASRIRAMEESLERITRRIAILDSHQKRLKNSFDNKKQMELLSGISLWQKGHFA